MHILAYRPSSLARGTFIALALAATLAVAAPPPGHPSPDTAMQIMQPGIEPPAQGPMRSARVLSHQDANEYTYVEVSEDGQVLWLAAPKTPVADGATVRFPDGVTMRDFYSKLLQRTFPAVIFVRKVEVVTP